MQRIDLLFTAACIYTQKFKRKHYNTLNSSLPNRTVADALWLMMAKARGGEHWLANAQCEVESIQFNTAEISGSAASLPVCLPLPTQTSQSYVLSPRSAWIDYAKDEALRHLPARHNRIAQFATRATTQLVTQCALTPLRFLLQQAGLQHAAIVGNHLISTNLYPDWRRHDTQHLLDQLIALYPDRPILLRNICSAVNPQLTSSLQAEGWHLIPARIVYLCDPSQSQVWKHNHVKQDAKLLAQTDIDVLTPNDLKPEHLPQLRRLFRELFIDKHSRLNPDFTPAFFELCLENRFLDLYALRQQNTLVGVLGIYEDVQHGWITTPLIGYDHSQPQSTGIYRRLMALLLQQARLRQTKLHYSSGASQFKRARGGQPQLEYSAIYSRHLGRRAAFSNRAFAQLMQSTVPTILKKADQL
jgi:hypothetical protein